MLSAPVAFDPPTAAGTATVHDKPAGIAQGDGSNATPPLVPSPSSPPPTSHGSETSATDPGPGPQWLPAMRLLRRSVAVELLVAAVILAFTAILVNVATGREAYAPTFTASQPIDLGGAGGAGTVHVFVGPARLGPNTIDVYFTGAHGGSDAPTGVTATLSFPAGQQGPTALDLTETAPGQYQTQSAVAGNTGQWTLTVTVHGASRTSTATFSFGVH
jgi:copper transport protein